MTDPRPGAQAGGSMAAAGEAVAESTDRARLARRARRLAWAANVWHLIEFSLAVGFGVVASSVALVSFGADSLIEAAAGLVVVWRFGRQRRESPAAERRAQQLVAVSFFLLGAYVLADTAWTMLGATHARVSWPGIALASFTTVTMPLLALAKRRVGRQLGSAATVSEASQNIVCAYLSVALLLGLGLNAAFGLWWADSLAALVIALVAAREGVEAWRGNTCCETC